MKVHMYKCRLLLLLVVDAERLGIGLRDSYCMAIP